MRHHVIRQSMCLAMLLVGLSATLPLSAAEGADKPELPRNAEDGRSPPKSIDQRSQAIKDELAGLPNHAWAGSYYEGDGLGENVSLHIAPGHGVTATWHGCMGLYGANEGLVEARADGSLHLDFLWRNKEEFGGFAEQLVPVTWGERHYLVPGGRMVDFVDAINAGYEPRQGGHGMFLLRAGDENKPAPGLPGLPSSYLALLRTEPAEFAVTSVEAAPPERRNGMCTRHFRLHFATHGDTRLRVGSTLRVVSPKGSYDRPTVKSIAGDRVVAEFAQYADQACRFDEAAPTLRWRLQAPGHRVDGASASVDARTQD